MARFTVVTPAGVSFGDGLERRKIITLGTSPAPATTARKAA